MTEIQKLESKINRIEERNKKVEKDKAWETSWTRKVTIIILTYLTILVFFFATGLPNPFLNSIVPTAAFVLSTLSLPVFKRLWMRYHK